MAISESSELRASECMHSEFIREQFRREVKRGTAFNAIAKKLGVGRTTALRWHKEMKLPRPVRGTGAPCHAMRPKTQKFMKPASAESCEGLEY